MKVLVTGGCGFIGSHFIRLILGKYKDINVVNLDKLTYGGDVQNCSDYSSDSRYSFVRGDICESDVVKSVMAGVDVVYNFAAESHVDRSIANASDFVKTNVLGTFVLMEEARKQGVKRFIQISTDEVYGSIDSGSFSEGDLLRPRNPYSASKAAADQLANSYFITYNFPVIITRSSNNFGPNQHTEKLIPNFITKLLKNEKVGLYGDGLHVRDWIYVEDNCKAIDLIGNFGNFGEVYNVSGSMELKNIEITKKILGLLGKNESSIIYVKDRPGHDRRYSLDCSKIKALGWKVTSEFDDSLKYTVEWYKTKNVIKKK